MNNPSRLAGAAVFAAAILIACHGVGTAPYTPAVSQGDASTEGQVSPDKSVVCKAPAKGVPGPT